MKTKPISNTILFEGLLRRTLHFQKNVLLSKLENHNQNPKKSKSVDIESFPQVDAKARSFKEIAECLYNQLEYFNLNNLIGFEADSHSDVEF